MKTTFLVLITLVLGLFSSCDNDGDYETVNIATPQFLSLEVLRSSVAITAPKQIVESGKIYAKENAIFVNDVDKGIHIIDNTNPASPQKIAFISIPGNRDMEVKGDFLYADSYVDLVVFDLSDTGNIKEVARLKDVFPYYAAFPMEPNVLVDYSAYQDGAGIVIGWEIRRERRKVEEPFNGGIISMETFALSDAAASTGQGGSLARFKIVENYLYSVDSHSIHIFNIESLGSPNKINNVFAGFDIETIFNRNNYLFLGSMSGMFVYDISVPSTPEYVSEFMHGTACDPVVVDENHAFITLRGGNRCGATESSLQIVDITDIEHPSLIKSYAMDGPYGLGVKNDLLFVCDGDSGLKVYNKANVGNIQLIDHFKNIETYDVIPMESHLLMIGNSVLYQYNYTNNGIELISQISLN